MAGISTEVLMSSTQHFPLTYFQEHIWYADQVYPGAGISNYGYTLELGDNPNHEFIEKTINELLLRNDALRIQITDENSLPRQFVAKFNHIKPESVHLPCNTVDEYIQWAEKTTRIPFPSHETPFYYFAVVTFDHYTVLYYKIHQLIADKYSGALIAEKIAQQYHQLQNSQGIGTEPAAPYFSRINLLGPGGNGEKPAWFSKYREYWHSRYDTIPDFIYFREYSGKKDTQSSRAVFPLERKTATQIADFCKKYRIPPFVPFLSALSIFIYRTTAKIDLSMGAMVPNRLNAKEKHTIGMFANLLPLRILVDNDLPFDSFTTGLSRACKTLWRYQRYPYRVIWKEYRKYHQTADHLFDILLSHSDNPTGRVGLDKARVRSHGFGNSIFSMMIELASSGDADDSMVVYWDYITARFSAREIEQMYQHTIQILQNALKNPSRKLSQLEMLSEAEKQLIMGVFNNTDTDYPGNKTVHQFFEETAAMVPGQIAVYAGECQYTYAEINNMANQLARHLVNLGTASNDIIGIMVERSVEMVVGLLGILKAGAAYLPIDPDYPEERVRYILNDSQIRILLTVKALASKPGVFLNNIILLDNPDIYHGSTDNPKRRNTSQDPIYVLYTSGSTGNPKGVMIEHYSVINRIVWGQKNYPLSSSDVVLQKTPYTFDVSVPELFWWSFAGAKVCMLPPGGEKDPETIVETVSKYKVTSIHFVPSMLNAFMEYVESLDGMDSISSIRWVFASGEALSVPQIKRFNHLFHDKCGIRLINLYGPTEAAIEVSSFDCSTGPERTTVPIGKPIDNIRLYIFDSYQKLQPVGVPGELYIAGTGVGRGYLNRPELTAEKFLPDPFHPRQRMYKTGDLTRWAPDGNIEYLGRIDHQIKIRGFRIELGEIEFHLLKYKGIKETVVVANDNDSGGKYLIAYLVADNEINIDEMRETLVKFLPAYMVPSFFVQLPELPLLTNGKINRKALPIPKTAAVNTTSGTGPRNELEKNFLDICREELGIPGIQMNDNFLAMGGDSIAAVKIADRLLNMNLRLPVASFFEFPTLTKVCAEARTIQIPIGQGPVTGECDLTPIQHRLLETGRTPINRFYQSLMLHSPVNLDEKALLRALKKLVEQHDALRIIFQLRENSWNPVIREMEGDLFHFEAFDLRGKPEWREAMEREALRRYDRMDSERGIMVGALLFNTDRGGYFQLIIHQLIVDIPSWRIILRDLQQAYSSAVDQTEIILPEKTHSYQEWAKQLRMYAGRSQVAGELNYWETVSNLKPPAIPKDYWVSSERNDSIFMDYYLSKAETGELLRNTQGGIETGAVLLTALGLTIKQWTGQNTVLVNYVGNERVTVIEELDITNTVGCFDALHPVALDMSNSDNTGDELRRIRENLRQIPSGGAGFGILRYETDEVTKKKLSVQPELFLRYGGQLGDEFPKQLFRPVLSMSRILIGMETGNECTIAVGSIIINGSLSLSFRFDSREYKRITMLQFIHQYTSNLKKLLHYGWNSN